MKYFSKKVNVNGITFDSKTEANRYLYLLSLAQAGKITQLELQKEFELLPKQTILVKKQLKTKTKLVERVDERAVGYHADFYYFDVEKQKYIIEEVKSKGTMLARDYPLRKKLIKLMVKRMNEENDVYEFSEIVVK